MKNLFFFLSSLFFLSGLNAQANIKSFGDANSDENFMNEDKWSEIIRKITTYTVESYAGGGITIYDLQTQFNKATGTKDYAVLQVGTNDALRLTIDAKWKADYKSIIQTGLINAGYLPEKIYLVAPSENTQGAGEYGAKMALVHQYIKEITSELHTQFIDLYDEAHFIVQRTIPLTVYNLPARALGDDINLSGTGQALLADMVLEKVKKLPPTIPGVARIKIWGAGSAMAGQSTYHSHFVQLFAEETGRQYENYSIAGTGLGNERDDNTQFYYTRQKANEGVKDIAIFLYGNNDGNGSPGWISLYEKYITESFINNGYEKRNLVVMTITKSERLATENNQDYVRIGAANKNIRAMAARLGITLMDLERNVPQNMYADPYHINDNGHRYVASMLEQFFSAPSILPIKTNSLKITWISANTFRATFIASQTTNTERFRLMYSEDGKNFKEAYSIVPEKLESEKQYTFTFKTNN